MKINSKPGKVPAANLKLHNKSAPLYKRKFIPLLKRKIMETRKYKTSAKCQGCVAKIAPFLNNIMSQDQWTIDLSGPDKILTVNSDCPEKEILEALQKAGFKGELLK